MKVSAVLLGGLCVVLLAAFGADPKAPRSDKELIQGIWQHVGWRIDGRPVRSDPHRKVFDGDQLTSVETREDRTEKKTGSFSLNSSKSPKEIDFTIDRGNNKGQITVKGIYSLEDDVLLICTSQGAVRPKVFAGRKGDGQELIVLIREERPE